MTNDATKLADLPSEWEAEAAEIEERREKGELSGEVWDARYDILTENASDLRLALAKASEKSTDFIPSSIYRLADWLAIHAYPANPAPESNDIADWALAKLQELQDQVDAK
jgi:hypothetical protein